MKGICNFPQEILIPFGCVVTEHVGVSCSQGVMEGKCNPYILIRGKWHSEEPGHVCLDTHHLQQLIPPSSIPQSNYLAGACQSFLAGINTQIKNLSFLALLCLLNTRAK